MKQHSSRFLNLVQQAKASIKEISPQTLKEKLMQQPLPIIIDVRDDNEWHTTSHIPGAVHLSKGVIERDIEKLIQREDAEIVVYCSGGYRCALVAENLQKMGYSTVYSLESGLSGWTAAGYPVDQ